MSTERDTTPFLEVREGPADLPPAIPLNRPITMIGSRQTTCHVFLPDKYVSKEHVRIVRKPDGFYAEDMQSHNNTYVRGERLTPYEPVRLDPGDVIAICHFRFAFVVPKPDSSTILNVIDAQTPQSSLGAGRVEDKLRAIVALSRDLVGVLDLEDVLDKMLATLFRIFPQADCGYVLLKETASGEPVMKASRVRKLSSCGVTISRTIFHHVMNCAEAVLSEDVERDFGDSKSVNDARIRTMMGVPLWDQQRKPVGIVQIDTRMRGRPFSVDDLDLLVAVADQMSVAVENARLHSLEFEHRQLERECRYAREVQRALLPKRMPRLEGFEFWHFEEPAWIVGGDYFDYNPVDWRDDGPAPTATGGSLAITVGDVAGKGMPAALLAARLSSEVRLLLKSEPGPAAAVDALNRELCENEAGGRFITFLLTVVDPIRHELTVVNAGHWAPVIRRADGRLEIIGQEESGMPLAIQHNQVHEAVTARLDPGDVVVLFTDGVTDATNRHNTRFEFARLLLTIASATGGPTAIGKAVLKAVREHAAGASPHDDLTLLCFGWGPNARQEQDDGSRDGEAVRGFAS